MSLVYEGIPLRFVLQPEYFSTASEIYLTSEALDLHFAEIYLKNLKPGAKLRIAVRSPLNRELLEFIDDLTHIASPFFDYLRTKYSLRNEILIKDTEDRTTIISSSSPLTQKGLFLDFHTKHSISEEPEEYRYLKKMFVLGFFFQGFLH